ncbi:predicted protein [Chaetoceros tenuissimus]|uniref:Uncharacterized protein n=1 Tax=Chaetoceros tenuissimus TaxID=426638 RepID=A0AAD3CZV2_9STRA|nr:predicted protein [Chaetoceros tenuissimus]
MPEVFYGAGQFYFMSSDYVGNKLSAKDRHLLSHERKTEDADKGSFLFSHERPLKFIDLTLNRFWEHGFKTEEDFREIWKMTIEEDQDEPFLPKRETFPFWFLCPEFLKEAS